MMDHLNSILEEAANITPDHFDIEPLSVDDGDESHPLGIKPTVHKAGKNPLSKKTWKKPADKPKRPLSAYNLFFQHEREKIITNNPNATLEEVLHKIRTTPKPKKRKHRKSHGMIGFAELARTIADKWKTIDEDGRAIYEEKAGEEKAKYKLQLEEWSKTREEKAKEDEKKSPIELARVQIAYDEPESPPEYNLFRTSHHHSHDHHSSHHHHHHHNLHQQERPKNLTSESLSSLIMSGNTLRRQFAHLNPNGDLRDYLKMTQQTIEMARASLSLPLFRNLSVPTHIMPGGNLGYSQNNGETHPGGLASTDFASSVFNNTAFESESSTSTTSPATTNFGTDSHDDMLNSILCHENI